MSRLPPEFCNGEDYALWLEEICIGQQMILATLDNPAPQKLTKEQYFKELKKLRNGYLDGFPKTPGVPV